MNSKKIILSIVCSYLFGYALYISAVTYDSLNFNVRDRQTQPAPDGHKPGKDNSTLNEVGAHMAGEDCGICHTPGGKASNFVFTMAGTLYEDKAGKKPLAGGEIILEDKDGKVISMTSNEVGNFWTYAPIASYPHTVTGSGTTLTKLYTENSDGTITPADPAKSSTWLYKTWVKKDDLVVNMSTIAPVGSSNPRMGCAMHHSPMSTRGALWASRKGTLSSYPKTELSFKKHIMPILRSRCKSCHMPGEVLSRLVMKSDIETPSTQVDQSFHHDLTSYGGSDVTVGNVLWSKYGAGYYATGYSANPDMSPLLLKTMIGGQNHGGGNYWTSADADYKAIRQWIAEGGQNN